VQLDQAGIKVDGPDALISDDAKLELLTHLRRATAPWRRRRDAAPRKITLRASRRASSSWRARRAVRAR
jgi:hypothetical protein